MDEPQYNLKLQRPITLRRFADLAHGAFPTLQHLFREEYKPMSATIVPGTVIIKNSEWNRECWLGFSNKQIAITINRPSKTNEPGTSLAIGLSKEEALKAGKHLCALGGLDVDKLIGEVAESRGTIAGLREKLQRVEESFEQFNHNKADDKKNAARWRHDSEELECIKMWLDKEGVHKADDMGRAYSVIGRIKLKESTRVSKAEEVERDVFYFKTLAVIDALISQWVRNKNTHVTYCEYQKAQYLQEHIEAAKHIKEKLSEALLK